jgi:peroxiredoxin
MAEQNEQTYSSRAMWIVPLVVLAIIVGLAVMWRILYTPPPRQAAPPVPEANAVAAEANGLVLLPPGKPPTLVSKEVASQPIVRAQVTIADVIRMRQHWNPAFLDWVDKQAPEFSLTDLNGKTQTLSSFRGRMVMLIFWATWCGPCKMEIPALIELRKQIPENKLAMLAISYENSGRVRQFLMQNPLNYTVIATPQSSLPIPYRWINAIPTTFFIDKDGTIRLAAEGVVLSKETELILKALEPL